MADVTDTSEVIIPVNTFLKNDYYVDRIELIYDNRYLAENQISSTVNDTLE